MSKNDKEYDLNNQRLHGLYMGYVKNTSDYQRMGRLDVWIPELTSSDEETITVIYGSPFAGASPSLPQNQSNTFEDTQKSYGFWAVPPDINNIVLIMFINGHISRGVWFSCLYQQDMNHMVPNIPVSDTFQQDIPAPAAEVNRRSETTSANLAQTRPYHKTHYTAIRDQGLKDDRIRGFSQSGARSEPTSRVSGFLSPKGHYWTIEDTDNDERIRLRSKSGVQVLLDDTNGMLYMINKSGKGWVEIDNEGRIMIYGEDNISMRSKGDINFRADRDVIMEAGRHLIMRSEESTRLEHFNFLSKTQGDHISHVLGDKNVLVTGSHHEHIGGGSDTLVVGSLKIGTDSDFNINAASVVAISSAADLNISSVSGTKIASSAGVDIKAGAGLNLEASAPLNMNASLILQNVGGGAIGASSATGPAPKIIEVPDLSRFNKAEITQPKSNEKPTETTISTIVTVFPTHEPCPEHKKRPEIRND